MSLSANPEAGQAAASDSQTTTTVAPAQEASNAIVRTDATVATDDNVDPWEAIYSKLDAMPDDDKPGNLPAINGEAPVSTEPSEVISPQRGSAWDELAIDPATEFKRAQTPKVEAAPVSEPAPEVKPQEVAKPEPQAVEEEEEPAQPGKLPQHRLRAQNEFDDQVLRLVRAGMSTKEAIAYLDAKAGNQAAKGPELPSGVPHSVPEIDAQLATLRTEHDGVDQQIEVLETELEGTGDGLDFERPAQIAKELKVLRAKRNELRTKGQTLAEARQTVSQAASQAQEQAQAEREAIFRRNVAWAEEDYPAIKDETSPLRQAMAVVHARWEQRRQVDLLSSVDKPQILIGQAYEEMHRHPDKYKPVTAPVASAPTQSQATHPPTLTVLPAPGNAGSGNAPSAIAQRLSGMTLDDIYELIA